MQKQQRDVHQHSPHGDFEIREHIDFCFTCISKTLPLAEQVALILKDVYSFKIKEIVEIINKSEAKVKHLIRDARQKMVEIFDARCALINKTGACHQCSELNGIFNPKQNIQEELVKLDLVKAGESGDGAELLKLRTQLVAAIDPLNADGTDLHDLFMLHLREVIGEVKSNHALK